MIWSCLAGHSNGVWEEGCECFEPWDLRFPARKRTVLENLTPTGSRWFCLLLQPSVSVTGQTTSDRPLLCAIARNFSSYHIRIRPNQFSYPEGEAVRFSEMSQHLTITWCWNPKDYPVKKINKRYWNWNAVILGIVYGISSCPNGTVKSNAAALQLEPGLLRILDTTHWRQVWSLFPKTPLARSITRYVWQLNIVSLLVFHLHAHNGPDI